MERTAGGITYTLTRRRVRNINLRVRADGSVAASASPRVPAAYVDAFVTARADWVRTRTGACPRPGANERPPRPPRCRPRPRRWPICRRCAGHTIRSLRRPAGRRDAQNCGA